MRIIKTKEDLELLRKAQALPEEILDLMERDLIEVQQSMAELGCSYDPDSHGHIIMLEPGDNIKGLGEVGLNPEDAGLLGTSPEFVAIEIAGLDQVVKLGIAYNNECIMLFYLLVGHHGSEVDDWLNKNIIC